MELTALAEVLASTDDRPARMARVLYLTEQEGALAPAGFADAIGDPASVLARLDTEGADGLAVQVFVDDEMGEAVPAAVVASRAGAFALAIGDEDGLDRAPQADDGPEVASCWRLVVHALGALDRADAVPEPPDDPHPGAYLMAAWLAGRIDAADGDGVDLSSLDLPSEADLADDLGATSTGWDAVHEVVAAARPEIADHLGRNGVAWQAHDLLGDPGSVLGALARRGHVDTADRLFDALTERGWARPVS